MVKLEQTLIIIKPDAVQRGLVGTIIEYLENIGLKLMAAKMLKPDKEVIKNHYPGTKDWISEMGKKTLDSFKQSKIDVIKTIGTADPLKLGQLVYERLINYWQEGPIVVMIWQGPQAIEIARKIRGHTIPLLAEPGTIHATYLYDSAPLAFSLNRVVKTFIHASGSVDEAEREIKYWFKNEKLINYERDVDKLYLK